MHTQAGGTSAVREIAFDKVGRVLLPQRIADQIQEQITSHKLEPGDRLPSGRELSDQFGVSRQCVREAYKMLEERGLVAVVHGRGVFVLDYEPHYLQSQLSIAATRGNIPLAHLYEVRRSLETSIAGFASQRRTSEDLARMEKAIGAMEDAIDQPDEFIVADQEFHTAMADATHNQLFSILVQPLMGLVQECRKEVMLIEGSRENAIKDHIGILGCIRKRDSSRTQAAVAGHLARFGRDIGIFS